MRVCCCLSGQGGGGSLRFWGPGLLSTSPAFSMSSASHSAGSSGWLAQKTGAGPTFQWAGKVDAICRSRSNRAKRPRAGCILRSSLHHHHRPGHSTETALLKVVNDLVLSLNKSNISVLALLDFSSAFDTIDHPILVHRLHTDFGFTDTVLQWFSSYLTHRTNYISLSNHCSDFAPVHSPGISSYFSPCIHTLSYNIHLLLTYNYRCLLPQIEYLSYFSLCSHAYVMSMLGQLRTCLDLMTTITDVTLVAVTGRLNLLLHFMIFH